MSQSIDQLSPERRALFERKLAATKKRRDAAADAQAAEGLPKIQPDPAARFDMFPLTDIQQAQWIGGRSGVFELGKVAAHLYVEFDSTTIDLDRLGRAWQRLIETNDQLRMVIRPSELKQQVLKEVPPYKIEVLDLRGKAAEQVDAEIAAIRERMAHQIFPGDRWPLFEVRATLLESCTRIHVGFDLLVADAWSFRVLMDRWMRVYANIDEPLPELEITYRDYVLHMEKLKETEMHRRSLEYWRKRLPTLPPAPELPLAKHPRDLVKQRSQHFEVHLPPEVWAPLRERGQRLGLTNSGLFLAAFAEVLTIWSKSPRFTINATVFNRLPMHPHVGDILVGEFNSFVLLAVDHSTPESFAIRSRRIQDQLWEDLENRYVSGVQIMRELAQVTGRNTGALMPVVFTSTLAHYEDEARAPKQWPGEMVYEISQTPQIWMEHHIWEENGALLLRCDAVGELFHPGMLDDMFKSYERLLHRLAGSDDAWQDTSRMFMVPSAHVEARAAVNATTGPRSELRLHELFESQARRQPDNIAVVTASAELSYSDVDRLSNQVAHQLRALGAKPNTLVAVVMEPGWQQVVGVLGVLKSGAAYLPIDPEVPAERLAYLLDNAKVSLALTTSHLAEGLAWPANVRRLVLSREALAGQPETALAPVQKVNDLAYVIYTSGSTGQPKGVMIDHQGAVGTIVDINRRFQVEPNDRILALASLSFDLSVYDVFGLLAAGGTIVVPAAEESRNPAHWVSLMRSHRVTMWNSVPALMEMLVDYLARYTDRLPESLRLVLMSGDWIPVRLPDRIRAIAQPDVQVISLGGATEASIWSILYPIGAVEPEWTSIPYGKPMVNQRFHVLNEVMDPCPVWVPGQLYIAGDGLAKGYWQDAEKTAASFITHPTTGERLYRTGDLGRYLPDGNIEFLGREDLQVKVLGHRIELGEIEAALQEHPKVNAVAVVAVGDTSETRRLVAYVVPGESEPTPEELSALAHEKLPNYMVPAQYLFLGALPLSPTGKVDRKALATRGLGQEMRKPFVAPDTPLQQKLADIWASVLPNVERIGIHDSFFELGGNSLLATQLIFKLRDTFHIEIPLFKFFEATAIDKLAVVIEETLIKEIEQMNDGDAEKLLSTVAG
ncbi:amino acid adenylation domain-containing protein [Sorangium sp. So ce281]|uniref:non-ribosomal peptide synthetase n=1 Tax=unclassified Sorangium TaxID=2621164 RepID=UPI003F5FF079